MRILTQVTLQAAVVSAAMHCVGHRGYSSKFPENTILALRESLLAGSQGVELDLMVSSDNQVFLMHDTTLARTTNCTGSALFGGRYNVPWHGYLEYCTADYTFARLGTKVPHFSELLDLLLEFPAAYALMDIKNGNPPEIMEYMKEVLESESYKGRDFSRQIYVAPWVMSPYIERAKQVLPHFPTSLIHSTIPDVSLDVNSFNVNFRDTQDFRAFVRASQASGKKVYSWTINTIANLRAAVSIAIDGAVTDFVADCVQLQAKQELRNSKR